MKLVIDIECNRLEDPDKIWVIVCKDLNTNQVYIFRNLQDEETKENFLRLAEKASLWIGHNILDYDFPILRKLLGWDYLRHVDKIIDTLIVSRLVDYPRKSHALKDYGIEFNLFKGDFKDWSRYSKEMEEYCVRDVEITALIYKKYLKYLSSEARQKSIRMEHEFQVVVTDLHTNGFFFNEKKARALLDKVQGELDLLDSSILDTFKPRSKLIREVTPKATKYGTISLSSVPKAIRECIHELSVGSPFSFFKWETFNPSSHKQVIQVLNEANWSPTDKTETHKDIEREYSQLSRSRLRNSEVDLRKKELYNKLQELRKTGWKINEANLDTLPPKAPPSARLLAKRIVLEARRRTLTEWLSLVREDGRIHGKFLGIGAWTHRMAHQNPNTANIPNEFDTFGKKKLYGKELRSLWCAPRNRLLAGVDAEGIQLRIFAHYIDDPDFTRALVEGKKEDKSDPHSLNQSILGSVCKSRAAAKRFIYALLLGAGTGKLSEILGCDEQATLEALDRLLKRYEGFAYLKEHVIPADAKRGWFLGLDGRAVRIPGDAVVSRRHLCMSGYLQNGEAVVMKMATLKFYPKLKEFNSFLVNFVHDEWQTETPNNVETALQLVKLQAECLKEVGEDLGLKCPLAGSYWNDDLKDYTIGTNWSVTH